MNGFLNLMNKAGWDFEKAKQMNPADRSPESLENRNKNYEIAFRRLQIFSSISFNG